MEKPPNLVGSIDPGAGDDEERYQRCYSRQAVRRTDTRASRHFVEFSPARLPCIGLRRLFV